MYMYLNIVENIVMQITDAENFVLHTSDNWIHISSVAKYS